MTAKPILICYDGSDGAERAIEFAAAAFPRSDALVLSAWEPYAPPFAWHPTEAWPAGDDLPLMQIAERVAAQGCRLALQAGLAARPLVAEADRGVAAAVMQAAEAHDVSLIVMGAHGLSSPHSRLLGPVALDVAHHSGRPLTIVP